MAQSTLRRRGFLQLTVADYSASLWLSDSGRSLKPLVTSQPQSAADSESLLLRVHLAFSTLVHSRALDQGMGLPTLRLDLPTSIKAVRTIPPRDMPA